MHPLPSIPEPAPQPGEPEPGGRPSHDPPIYPEHDRSPPGKLYAAGKPTVPDAWTPDLPLDGVVFDESRMPG
jgi:hypothetical protein